MKNLKDRLKLNESIDDATMSSIERGLNSLARTQSLSVTEIKGKLLTKCAGYIIEEWVKEKIQNLDVDSKVKFKPAEDKWYDFIYDGSKVDVKAFQKGKKYSNTKLTESQAKNKDQLIFILVEYTATNELELTNIEVVKGSDLKINNDRLVKN